MAEAMRERVRDFRFSWSGKQFAVGASVGLVPLSRSLGNLADALSRADAACYAAKDTGRNRVHVYDPDDRELSLRKGQMKWVSRIQRALDEDRFRLYFQTIVPVDGVNGDVGYFEVLLRMQDDDGTDIPPGAFIPAAERYGLMPEIDHWVVRHALDGSRTIASPGTRDLPLLDQSVGRDLGQRQAHRAHPRRLARRRSIRRPSASRSPRPRRWPTSNRPSASSRN
jgi:predicted signal transduction protein with EAL and GGDEF domain